MQTQKHYSRRNIQDSFNAFIFNHYHSPLLTGMLQNELYLICAYVQTLNQQSFEVKLFLI